MEEYTMSKVVKKALSPEETAVIENIKSLVDQLTSTGSAIETEVANAGIVPEEEEQDPEEVMKESNGPTANPEDKAEDRVGDGTDITEGNLSEVGKSLAKLIEIMGAKPQQQIVKKSATPSVDQTNLLVMKSLAEISNVMKSLADQQNQQNTAISNILDGIGFTQEVNKSLSSTPKNTPVGNMDGANVVNELAKVLKDLQSGQQQSQDSFSVRKSQHTSLAEALPQIFNVQK